MWNHVPFQRQERYASPYAHSSHPQLMKLFLSLLVRFLNTGDTFSGEAHFDSCIKVEDHPISVMITESAGNLIRVQLVSRADDRVRSWSGVGFFHVGSKKLLLTPDEHAGRSLELVCSFARTNDGAECQILTDGFATQCGSVQLKRDHLGKRST